jgi:hypothetical protein
MPMPVQFERLSAAQVEARRVAAIRAADAIRNGGPTPRLLMLATHTGSPDGHNIHTYTAGEVYDATTTPRMSAHLAVIFLRAGWAVDADATPDEPEAIAAPEPTPELAPATRRAQRRPGPLERKGASRESAE